MANFTLHFLLLAVIPTLLLLLLLTAPQLSSSAKILSVAFISIKSHKITYEPLLYELAARGHQLTILAPYISGKARKNVREIQTVDAEKLFEKAVPNFFEMKERNEQFNPLQMAELFAQDCELTYNQPHVLELLEKEKFDLIILPAIFNECTAGYVYKFNTSVILVSPMLVPPWVIVNIGNPSPPSFIPSLFTGYGDSMTFYERLLNFVAETLLRTAWFYFVEPKMEAIYRQKLNDPTIPSNAEILKNVSLILSNSHLSLSKPKPFLPDIVEVGGMHCEPAKPLPKDLDDFLNSSGSDGFIYFSMGSALKGSVMPEKYRQIFLQTFSKIKQKVLWKWETETMEGLPKNVKLSKWLPQQDVLGHPKIRAFITHGGFGGTTEAVYHGVPLIGIPMFGDQNLNMKKSEAAGFAVNIDFNSLSEARLLNAINKVLKEPSYKENVQKLSKIFRDQPDKPLDRAVFWTEYVLRHKGAPHLRSAARELNFIQYHSIDVIATLVGILFLTLYIVFAILRWIVRKLCCSSSKKSKSRDSGSKKRN